MHLGTFWVAVNFWEQMFLHIRQDWYIWNYMYNILTSLTCYTIMFYTLTKKLTEPGNSTSMGLHWKFYVESVRHGQCFIQLKGIWHFLKLGTAGKLRTSRTNPENLGTSNFQELSLGNGTIMPWKELKSVIYPLILPFQSRKGEKLIQSWISIIIHLFFIRVYYDNDSLLCWLNKYNM